MEEEKSIRKENMRVTIIVAIAALLIGGGCGFFISKAFGSKESEKNEGDNDNKNEETTQIQIDNIPILDKFVFEHGNLYIINNKDVYLYNTIDFSETKKWGYDVLSLTHSGCMKDNSSDYCNNNPSYDNKSSIISGVSNVKRLKLFNRVNATDESFSVYAITEDGNIYLIEGTDATKFIGNNDVEDMLTQDGDSYEILLKNGKHMIYEWHMKDGTDNEWESTYTEKQ